MSDIVTRLRGAATKDYGCTCVKCEAADDIERLRAELASAIKQRVAELESQPTADRDLRERLVCAALTGLCADPNMNDLDIPCIAVDIADAALAAMRKGEA